MSDEIQSEKLRIGWKMFVYMTVLMLSCMGSCGILVYLVIKFSSIGNTMTSTSDEMNERKPAMNMNAGFFI
jgi:hypothetical protein